MKGKHKISATPAYPKPLGVSFLLLALDNLHIFQLLSAKLSKCAKIGFLWSDQLFQSTQNLFAPLFSRQYLLNSLMHFVNGKIPRLILGCVHRIRCSKTKATLKASHNVCHSWIRAPRDQQSKWPKKSALYHFWKPSKSLKARRIHARASIKKPALNLINDVICFFLYLVCIFLPKYKQQ